MPLAENLGHVAEEAINSKSILEGFLLISDNDLWWKEVQIISPELR